MVFNVQQTLYISLLPIICSEQNEEVVRIMTFPRICRSMQRARTDFQPSPAPQSLDDFGAQLEDPQYAERFAAGKDGKPYFRLRQTGNNREGTNLIFISENLRHLLTESKEFHIDGHFKMTPRVDGAYQILTIMPVAYDCVSSYTA